MGITPAVGWLGLFLFAATAEARGLATLARPSPPKTVLATFEGKLTHDATRPGDEATGVR